MAVMAYRFSIDLAFHDRETAISWSLQNGASIWEVSQFFGVSPQIIIKVYGPPLPRAA
jgi:hypothetical protein